MGKKLVTIIAGVAVLTLVVLAITALTTQTRPASAETGYQATTAVQSPTGQDCGTQCPGQEAQGASAGAAQGCDGCAATAAEAAGAQAECPGGGDCGQ